MNIHALRLMLKTDTDEPGPQNWDEGYNYAIRLLISREAHSNPSLRLPCDCEVCRGNT